MFWTKISATNRHDADDGDRRVLAVQVGARALLDGQRDALHPLVARRERQQGARRQRAVEDRAGGAHEGDDDPMVRQKVTQQKSSAVLVSVPREDSRARSVRPARSARASTRRKGAAQSIVPAPERVLAAMAARRPGTHSRPLARPGLVRCARCRSARPASRLDSAAGPGPARPCAARRRLSARRLPRPCPAPGCWAAAPRAAAGLSLARVGHLQLRQRVAQRRAAPARLAPLEDRQQGAHAVDRVADLLEVALAARGPRPSRPSRRPPRLISETAVWTIRSALRDPAQFLFVGRAQLLLARLPGRAARAHRSARAHSLHLLGIASALCLARRPRRPPRASRPPRSCARWRCAPLRSGKPSSMPSSARTGAVQAARRSTSRSPGTPRRARSRSAGRPGRSGSRATCSPRSAAAAGLEGHAVVDVARRLRDAGDDQRGQRLGLPGGRLRVADPHLDGAEARSAAAPTTRPA